MDVSLVDLLEERGGLDPQGGGGRSPWVTSSETSEDRVLRAGEMDWGCAAAAAAMEAAAE